VGTITASVERREAEGEGEEDEHEVQHRTGPAVRSFSTCTLTMRNVATAELECGRVPTLCLSSLVSSLLMFIL
jgi:hypothetical protein